MEEKKGLLSKLPGKEKFAPFFEEISFEEYLELVAQNPKLTRTSFQRVYDMIASHGERKYNKFKEEVIHYNFFDDLFFEGRKALYGLDRPLMKLVEFFKSAAQKRGHERRLLLLVGPVASGKSTLLDLLKKGLEEYSKTENGKLYSLLWTVRDDDTEGQNILGSITKYEQFKGRCPVLEDPLRLLPAEGGIRNSVLEMINQSLKDKKIDFKVEIEGDACPLCRYYFNRFVEKYHGDWQKVLNEHVRVYRLVLSEKDRRGIGTFQPVDEKNQDSTELTGDVNYRKLAEFGAEDDPRAFNFRFGEFNIANRGILEFKEVLKLAEEFLYPLLEATQSHTVKPKGFSAIDIDEIPIGHTNEPEFKKLQKNEKMEALKDRTIQVDVPNIIELSNEVRIYERDYGEKTLSHLHKGPHMFEMLGLWMIATRVQDPKKMGLTRIQKIMLLDGKTLPGYTEDTVKELLKEPGAERDGLDGLSPRYAQNALANLSVKDGVKCINGFMLFGEDGALATGLHEHNPLISDKEKVNKYRELLPIIRGEFENRVQADVQKAVTGDIDAVKTLFTNYIDNIAAFVESEKIRDKFGQRKEPDEFLMRSIEEKMEPPIPDSRKEDFRRQIMAKLGSLARGGTKFEWNSDDRLRKALEKKLYEERKDTIKLESLVSTVMDDETRKKIDTVRTFMVEKLGYCEICAKDALEFVASLRAKGEPSEREKKQRN